MNENQNKTPPLLGSFEEKPQGQPLGLQQYEAHGLCTRLALRNFRAVKASGGAEVMTSTGRSCWPWSTSASTRVESHGASPSAPSGRVAFLRGICNIYGGVRVFLREGRVGGFDTETKRKAKPLSFLHLNGEGGKKDTSTYTKSFTFREVSTTHLVAWASFWKMADRVSLFRRAKGIDSPFAPERSLIGQLHVDFGVHMWVVFLRRTNASHQLSQNWFGLAVWKLGGFSFPQKPGGSNPPKPINPSHQFGVA